MSARLLSAWEFPTGVQCFPSPCAPHRRGVITGCMLAFARVAGETAPLLFTAFGNQFWSTSVNEPIAALPLQIFIYAISPYDEWHRLAWGGALVLIVLIVVSVALVRYVAGRGVLKGAS